MTNNDVLRTLRFALELTPGELADYLGAAGVTLPLHELAAALKDDEEPGFRAVSDFELGALLDGFILVRRGPREGSSTQAPERLTNNRVLRALRIAFELRDTDIQELMAAAGREVSKGELSALFRRADHRNYQPCGDQFLRTFLRGLGVWHRETARAAQKRPT
jgi:uncharacterized protein YehS (DUF1456 family)